MTCIPVADRASRRRSPTAGIHRRSFLLPGLAALLLTAGLLFAVAAPAAAHDEIVSSSPEAGSTIPVVPEEISLTFSGEILTDFSAVIIEVVAANGQNLASGDPIIDGTTVTQAVQPGQAGVFTVRWRVVSSDGHPISNEYQYTVEAVAVPTSTPTPEATEEQTPAPSATTQATTPGEMHNGPSGGGELLPVLAVVSGVGVLGGALIVVLMVARERRSRDGTAAAAASGQGNGDGNTRKDGLADES
ncbi:Copper resistance protein C precursor [Microbacterium laevaniformans]|uniref:Copper resistance protein C n=1 Tax=Microbacterium laevaniformans TaxID=36807 RepID=A0A150HI36_9MICO|nr:copper resistance CopC family protein [Microbacterium laevaniformans]KXZ61789.1 Copper resistance protein C precursor [Microbacterium laevaniformans]